MARHNACRALIVDKPSVCQRGLPGRLSSHCSSIQHGRSTALTSSLVALPASLGLLRPVSRTARGLRAPSLRWPSVPALRTASARASSRFAASNGQRPGRECIFPFRTALRFACAVFRACALRVLGTSALRAFTFLQGICIHSSQSSICIARKLACSSRCSLGALRAVSLTERALRAPHKNARNDVHAVISDLSLVLPILCQCSELVKKVFLTSWWMVARRSRDGGIAKELLLFFHSPSPALFTFE